MSIEMKNVINAAGANAQYDECAKRILGQKSILSWILANTVEEFKGMNPKDIIPLIEGNIQIGNIPAEPGLTNTENNETGVIGFNTEDSEIKEGLVRFDIVFYVQTKNGKAQIIINVEAQKSEPTKYDIVNRGIFYVSRLISSQKGRDFVKSNYNDIKNVYSIWVCMNIDENCMNHIRLKDEKILGDYTWRGNLELFNLIMIGLTSKPAEYEEKYKLHRLLSSVLSNTLSAEEKLKVIENEYDILVEDSFRREVDTMCNLSQGIEEKGIEKGKAEIILNMYKEGYSLEQIAKVAKMDKKSIEKICATCQRK